MSGARRGSRRTTSLRAAVALVGLVLAARFIQIQIVAHDHYRQRAQAQWVHPEEISPFRGNLYDRQGRALALSVRGWRIGVAPSQVTEPDSVITTLVEVLGCTPEPIAHRLRNPGRGHLVVAGDRILDRARLERLKRWPGITREPLRSRVYPFGPLAASLVGFYRFEENEGSITTALENGLDAYLAGKPGRAQTLATAFPDSSLGKVVLEPALHGDHLFLTIDAAVQEICESHLARAVVEYGAIGGSVLVVDPGSGDIVAAASWPLLDDRGSAQPDPAVWHNRNFTVQYEPGSVFKIFTAASLLLHAAVDTATTYDCSDFQFPGFTIRNSEGHAYGDLAFMSAFAQSSNVYFARAVANLAPAEFYRDLTEFGFGQKSPFPYPGQVVGSVKAPAQWSRRSQATIAIGQEIAVTPLQVAMAAAAIANGGWLYAPRVVREIRSQDTGQVRTLPPTRLRRILPSAVADLLRKAMTQVVAAGTGRAADCDWISVAGKTGTAQKSRDGHGYTQGCYVASFLGCVPADRPRLLILTVLDEPEVRYHYASQSAAPLFANIVKSIRQSSDWLTVAEPDERRLIVQTAPAEIVVPDVLYLNSVNAAERLERVGLVPGGGEKIGTVVGQSPAPGSLCLPGTEVCLTVAGHGVEAVAEAAICPDLLGLSNRQVAALAARLGVAVRVAGIGYVQTQDPPAGTPLKGDPVRVRMVSTWQ